MRRRTLIILAVLGAALLAALLAWKLVWRATPPPTQVPGPAAEAPSKGRAVINLYLTDPNDLSELTENVELTLLTATAVGTAGEETVFEGATKIIIKRELGEKILSVPIPSGRLETITLTFSPVASTRTRGGAVESLYVERREVEIVFAEDVPLGRTLVAAIRIPLARAFGALNGVPSLKLPERVAAERAIVGGMLIGDQGRLFTILGASIETLVAAEYGLNLAAAGQPGSEAVSTPTTSAP